jgi:hypothetical protein
LKNKIQEKLKSINKSCDLLFVRSVNYDGNAVHSRKSEVVELIGTACTASATERDAFLADEEKPSVMAKLGKPQTGRRECHRRKF